MDIEQLINDEAFVMQIENAKDLAEVAALFQAKGVEVTEEDLKAALTAEDGELDEAALEDVAGGINLKKTLQKVKKFLRVLGGPVRPWGVF